MSVKFEGLAVPVFKTPDGIKTVADILERDRAFLVSVPNAGKDGDRVLLISLDWANRIEVKGTGDGQTVLIPYPVMRREAVERCFPETVSSSFREIVVRIFACDATPV